MRNVSFSRLAAVGAVVLTASLGIVGVAAAGHGHHGVARVLVQDDCEPASFNHAIGPHTCVGNGTTTFGAFIGQLQTLKDAPAWRFDPSELNLLDGRIMAVNVGGEFHTFTEVKEFGGGCVAPLNAILGLTPVAECSDPTILATTGVAPGQSLTTGTLAPGVHRFECLIHPWMRATAVVN